MLGALPKEQRPKGIPSETFRTGKAQSTRSAFRAEWVPTDFALACGSMPRLSWVTLTYTVFGADEDRTTLWAELMSRASKLSVREQWPTAMRRGRCMCGRAPSTGYKQDLCTLVLLEWAHPNDFRTQEQLARWFGVDQSTWSKVVSKRYQPLRDALEIWFGGALGHIWRSIRGEE